MVVVVSEDGAARKMVGFGSGVIGRQVFRERDCLCGKREKRVEMKKWSRVLEILNL